MMPAWSRLICLALALGLGPICALAVGGASDPEGLDVASETPSDAERSEEQDGEAKDPAAGRDLSEPGYSLTEDTRSPFLPIEAYRAARQPDSAQTASDAEPLLQEALVRRKVKLDAVVAAAGRTTAIINRVMLRIGESIDIRADGKTYSLRVEDLKTQPPTAILAHQDRRFTVTAGKGAQDNE